MAAPPSSAPRDHRINTEGKSDPAMARLPYLNQSDLAAADQDLLARDINLHRALAHSPHGARSFLNLGKFIRYQSRLDPRLRELAILQVGYVTRSPYEYSHHIKIARDFGVSDDDIKAMIEETAGRETGLEPLAKAVLRAARDMTLEHGISDETFAALRSGLDNERVTDLVMTIAFYNGVVRLLGALKIDVEESYLRYLDEFPLPIA
jgi:alkylhydroperoxidase family enzyme